MAVLVKLTRSHQVTLPKRLLEQAGWAHQEYFVADLKEGALVLTPMTLDAHTPTASIADLRRHFARLGVTQRDVRDAVAWVRERGQRKGRRRRAAR